MLQKLVIPSIRPANYKTQDYNAVEHVTLRRKLRNDTYSYSQRHIIKDDDRYRDKYDYDARETHHGIDAFSVPPCQISIKGYCTMDHVFLRRT